MATPCPYAETIKVLPNTKKQSTTPYSDSNDMITNPENLPARTTPIYLLYLDLEVQKTNKAHLAITVYGLCA